MIHLAPGLELPADATVHRLAFIGTTNSGKTYSATLCAEQMWHAGMQFVALDVMGIWWGLRVCADGEEPGLPINIFGGKHQDVPITEHDGALVAEVIHRTGISAIIDISGFRSDAEKVRFATRFADRLYWLRQDNPGAIHLFLEEAHEYLPQNLMPGDSQMVHVWQRIWKQGGNFGIGGSLITQRPQDVSKKALDLSACVFAHNTTGADAVEKMRKWLRGIDVADLESLPPGECIVWSTSWLRIRKKFKIDAKETFHARFDPLAAPSGKSASRTLAAVDVAALREQFAAAAEAQASEDPKLLRDRIAQLEAQLATAGPSEADLDQAVREAAEAAHAEGRLKAIDEMRGYAQDLMDSVEGMERRVWPIVERNRTAPPPPETPAEKVSAIPEILAFGREQLTPLQTSMIDAIATFEALGVAPVSLQHVGAFIGKWHNAGPIRKAFKTLDELGLTRTEDGHIKNTGLGENLARPQPTPTLAEIHAMWLAKVEDKNGRLMLEALLANPIGLYIDELGTKIGKNMNAGPIRGSLNSLRDAGLISIDTEGGLVAPTRLLFPEGIR